MQGRRLLSAAALIGMVTTANTSSAGDSAPAASEQAVLVHFDYGSRDWKPFFQFEDRLQRAIAASGAGEYDGNELATDGSDGSLYMYGPDADKLFAVVKPLLESSPILKHVVVTLRYGKAGDPNARQVQVRVGS